MEQWEALPAAERAWWQARHEREVARCSCGNPKVKCHDPALDWFPQLTVCHATRARESAQARFAELHKDRPWHDGTFTEWGEKQTPRTPYHHSHGTSVWVSDVDHNLGGDFLRWAKGDHEED